MLAESGIGTVSIPCPGVGVQLPQPLPFLNALEEDPPIASTVWSANPASEGIVPETYLVKRPGPEDPDRYSDTIATW